MYVVITQALGPIIGPFENEQAAIDWAKAHPVGKWYVRELYPIPIEPHTEALAS